jgi:hypothetical protein
MDEFLTVVKAVEPLGIAILIWRSVVADRERERLMQQQQKTQEWIEGLVAELLRRTDRGAA